MSLVVVCRLLFAAFAFFAVNCLLNAVCCLPSIVYRIRVVVCCLRACVCDTYRVKAFTVFSANCLPLTIYCSMSADDRLQVSVCCLSTVV